VSKNGIASGNAVMACHGEVQAAAETVAANGGDDWLGRGGDLIHQRLTQSSKPDGLERREDGDLGKIGAGSEAAIGTGENNCGDVRDSPRQFELMGELRENGSRKPRKSSGAAELEEKDGAVAAQVERRLRHSRFTPSG
jgi:hypothetical protein